MKKILGWSIIGLLLYLLVQDPASATRLVSGTIDLLADLAEGMMSVINGI